MTNRIFFPVLMATVLLNTGCGDNQKQASQPPPVAIAVYKASLEKAVYYDQYPATVTALNEVQIVPQVSGYVTGIYFKDGQYVKKGQKLYSIDQQQYKAGYDQSVANLNVARANLSRAQQDADRYQELAKKDAIAKQVVDHALADLQTAKMQVSAAEANVQNVQTGLRYSTISAPMSGIIGISRVKKGAAVTPGTTIFNTISSGDPIAVDLAVDEKQIPRFIYLQQQKHANEDSVFQVILPDGNLYPHPGKIDVIDRAVDPQTGTIRVRLLFPNKDQILRPGMSATIRILNNGKQEQLLIPYKAVVEQMGEYFVYVINDSTARQRGITPGNRIGAKIIVAAGLKEGETIATEGVQKLKDSATVVITENDAMPLGQK